MYRLAIVARWLVVPSEAVPNENRSEGIFTPALKPTMWHSRVSSLGVFWAYADTLAIAVMTTAIQTLQNIFSLIFINMILFS